VVQGSYGAHLLLTSTQTGASNTIQVSETDSGTALSALTYSSSSTSNYTQETAAQDANYSVSGVAGTSSSNTVTNALSGVTLTLLGTTPTSTDSSGKTTSTPETLSISTDTSTIESNITSFVSAYNTLVGSFNSLGSYDASTNTAGPMSGSALLSGIKNEIQNQLYSIVATGSTTYNTLASIGITTNKDGTLSVNGSSLSNALSTNFSAVSQLFSGTQGVATGLNSLITSNLASNGAVTSASNTLVKQENSLTDQTNKLNTQMAALAASLTQQYSALNTLLSSLQTTSSYLTQAFASLPTVQGQANA
jgi:flagellar hook-associated protein 2